MEVSDATCNRRDLSMTKYQSGIQVARGLRHSEHALDEAIAHAMRLGADMVDARKASRFAACVGQNALAEVATSIQAMTTARAALIAAHAELKQVADEHHIPWRMDGPTETKEKHVTGLMPTVANAA